MSHTNTVDSAVLNTAIKLVSLELSAVEERIDFEANLSSKPVGALIRHMKNAGGKRLRPAIIALSAKLFTDTPDMERLVRFSAAIELIHMATLVHDDVIDQPDTRRGIPPVNKLLGNRVSVLAGDAVFARAIRMLGEDDDSKIVRLVTNMVLNLCEGAALEAEQCGNIENNPSIISEIIGKKTASFIAGCAQLGAMIANASQEDAEKLSLFGFETGLAFQIADDILDYLGDPEKTGKTIGTDYRDGNCTLPLALTMNLIDNNQKDILRSHFGNGADSNHIVKICNIMINSGAIEQAEAIAHEHTHNALTLLHTLPDNPARYALEVIAKYVTHRQA